MNFSNTQEQKAMNDYGDYLAKDYEKANKEYNSLKQIQEDIENMKKLKQDIGVFYKQMEKTLDENLKYYEIRISQMSVHYNEIRSLSKRDESIKDKDENLGKIIDQSQDIHDNIDELKSSISRLEEQKDKTTSKITKAVLKKYSSIKQKKLDDLIKKGSKIDLRQQAMVLNLYEKRKLKDSSSANKEVKKQVAIRKQDEAIEKQQTKIIDLLDKVVETNELSKMLKDGNGLEDKLLAGAVGITGDFYVKSYQKQKEIYGIMKNHNIGYVGASALFMTTKVKENLSKKFDNVNNYLNNKNYEASIKM